MNISQIYIAVSIVVLAVIAILVFVAGKKEKRLTPLAGFAFAFVLAGILFGGNRVIGYGLLGIGVVLAILDIFMRSRK